jgi:anti-anti-sigma factor
MRRFRTVQPDTGGSAARPTMDADGLRVDRAEHVGRVVGDKHSSVLVYRVTGEIDTLTAPYLDLALTSADEESTAISQVVLDLTDVPFLSSAGLSILVEHHARCERDGILFAVVAAQHAVLRAIQITALDRIIPLYPTVSDALGATG